MKKQLLAIAVASAGAGALAPPAHADGHMHHGRPAHIPNQQQSAEEEFQQHIQRHIQELTVETLDRMLKALQYGKEHGGTQHISVEHNIKKLLGLDHSISLEQLSQILEQQRQIVLNDIQELQVMANDFSRTGGNSKETLLRATEALDQLSRAQEIKYIIELAQQAVHNTLWLKKRSHNPTGYSRGATVHGGGSVHTPQAEFYRHPLSTM